MRLDFEAKKAKADERLAKGQFEEVFAFFNSKDRAGYSFSLSLGTYR